MNLDKLKSILPLNVYNELQLCIDNKINTNIRMSHFLGQCHHESGGFKFVEENLNYSSSSLMRVFPKYFPTKEIADKYDRQPIKIANKVYANRMGNGIEASGDGYLYRGRGYIQLTGKYNYVMFSRFINDDCIILPDKVKNKYPLSSAAFYFKNKNILPICDKGIDKNTITDVTKLINGGIIGLDDRIKWTMYYYTLLTS